MTRAQLISQEQARLRAYSLSFWILAFAIVGGIFAVPSFDAFSPTLASLTGDSWLVPLIVGVTVITNLDNARRARCPRCRKAINGAIAVATDRCSSCGEIVVEDPLYKRN